jgi:hypothetical protein
MLCPDTIFTLRMAKDFLEYNLKRLTETENLFDYEKTLTKSQPKFLRRKELTLYDEGKKPLHM